MTARGDEIAPQQAGNHGCTMDVPSPTGSRPESGAVGRVTSASGEFAAMAHVPRRLRGLVDSSRVALGGGIKVSRPSLSVPVIGAGRPGSLSQVSLKAMDGC